MISRMLIMTMLVVCSALTVSCEKHRLDTSSLRYTKDARTGLCFAYGHISYEEGMFATCVPCEPIPIELLR